MSPNRGSRSKFIRPAAKIRKKSQVRWGKNPSCRFKSIHTKHTFSIVFNRLNSCSRRSGRLLPPSARYVVLMRPHNERSLDDHQKRKRWGADSNLVPLETGIPARFFSKLWGISAGTDLGGGGFMRSSDPQLIFSIATGLVGLGFWPLGMLGSWILLFFGLQSLNRLAAALQTLR